MRVNLRIFCLIVASLVLLSLGAYGMNISTPAWTLAKRINAVKDTMLLHSDLTSDEDIYKMIALCSYSDIKFSKSDRRNIERKIAAYPDSIVNGDTTRLELETTLKIAYYEFVRKDYTKALSSISNYYVYDNRKYFGLFSPFDFSSNRIHSKQKPSKEHKKKRLWTTPTPFPLRNDNVSFVADLLYNMPMTFDIDTYLLMFEIIKEGSMTNPSIGLLGNAVSCHRMDIVENYVSMFLPESGFRHNIIILGLYCLSKINSFETLSLECRDELISVGVSDDALRRISDLVTSGFVLHPHSMLHYKGDIWHIYDDDILNIVNIAFGEESDESAEIRHHLYDKSAIGISLMNNERLKEKIDEGIVSNDTMVTQYVNSLFGKLYGQCHYWELCSLAKAYEPYIPDKYKANFYNVLALSESSLGLYQQSIEHYDMSLQYVDSPTIKMNKGFAFTEFGDYEKALEMYQPFISDTSLNGLNRFNLFDYLGRLYSFVDKEQSFRYFNMAEEYMDDPFLYTNQKSRHYAWMSHAVANRYLQREYLNKAIKLDTEMWFGGIDTIPAGVDYTELGWFYTSNFDYSAADGCYQRAYNYLKRLTPEDKRRTTLDTYYASNLIRMQRIPEALEILNSLKNTQQRVLGSEHVEYMRTARLMLHALIAQGNSNACDSLYRKYTELVNHHPNEQNGYEDLMVKTDYYRMLGRNDSIVDLLETAFQKRENAERLELLTRYASALLATNSEQFAGRIGFISNASKETVASNFLKLSEQDRTSWQAPLNALQNIFVSANIGSSSGIVAKEALEYNLFTKGLLFHTRNAIYKRLSRSRSTKSSVENLKAMRDSLNIVVALGDSANTLRLADRVATLERQLSYKNVSADELRRIFNVDMQSVLSSMGKSSLAIDFVRYTVNDIVKYGAFLLSSKMKQPLFVDVCSEQELLSMARKADGSVSYQFYRDKTHKGTSYNMVWGQLAEYFAGYTDIYFSGDGVLNQLGIEYLTDADDVQACDRFRLHRVFHLADIRKPLTIGSEFVAVGVSDHNSPIADASTAERGGWSDLDGVVNEFNVVKSQFGQNDGKFESKFVINDDAREAYVKSLNNSAVSTLHIATHGFYMDKDGLYRAETDSMSVDHYVAHRALTVGKESLSGIILRKGNLSWKSPTITDEDDDILTSDEIENLTFPKLNLTVLSACETGLGDVDSEGVWGLQRAFRIAGTQSLICSLCRIDDKWTARFMEEFYRHAVAGETIYDSFHAARSFLFRENKKNAKVWSSMILIE